MLSIKQLVIKDYQHNLVLVDNLSFTLNKNDKIAIIGNEGSGKSTLLSVIKGERLPYVTISGEIIKPDVIAYLDQNIETKWLGYKVEDYLSFDLPNQIYTYYAVISKICEQFSLHYNAIKDRQINTFSGGEKVKIGLIKCLIQNPDLLLLDEPSNDLDFATLQFLEAFLIKTEIPTLFISHDQRLLENVCNGIIHLQHIHKKTKAKTHFLRIDYQTYKEHYFSKYESDLMVARKQRSDYKKKMDKFRQIYQKVEYQQDQAVRDPALARLLKKKIHSLKSQEKRYIKEKERFTEIPEKEEPMHIFFDQEKKKYTNKVLLDIQIKDFKLPNQKIINEISLSLKGNDKIVIIGDNGIGKTTLMRYIYKYLSQQQVKVGYISQNYLDVLNPNKNVVEHLLEKQNAYNESKVRQILGTLGLKKEEMTYQIKNISEGTKLKVLLLELTANDYDVLLLDEPTRNISPVNQDEMYELFLSFKGAIIAVTHDRKFIESVFDEVYELTHTGLKKC